MQLREELYSKKPIFVLAEAWCTIVIFTRLPSVMKYKVGCLLWQPLAFHIELYLNYRIVEGQARYTESLQHLQYIAEYVARVFFLMHKYLNKINGR